MVKKLRKYLVYFILLILLVLVAYHFVFRGPTLDYTVYLSGRWGGIPLRAYQIVRGKPVEQDLPRYSYYYYATYVPSYPNAWQEAGHSYLLALEQKRSVGLLTLTGSQFTEKHYLFDYEEDIAYPVQVPGTAAISFLLADDTVGSAPLMLYDPDTEEAAYLTDAHRESYDWLDENRVIFSRMDSAAELKWDLWIYDINGGGETLYRENADQCALSNNKEYLYYSDGERKDTGYLVHLPTMTTRTVTVDERANILQARPTDDGEYLAAHVIENWETRGESNPFGEDVYLIHVDSGRMYALGYVHGLPATIVVF